VLTDQTIEPWNATGLNVRNQDGGLICTVTNLWADQETPEAEKVANARLIAYAPSMLETVEMAAQFLARFLDTVGDLANDKDGLSMEAALLLVWCQDLVSSANGTDED
jgi:hypothetical protein